MNTTKANTDKLIEGYKDAIETLKGWHSDGKISQKALLRGILSLKNHIAFAKREAE